MSLLVVAREFRVWDGRPGLSTTGVVVVMWTTHWLDLRFGDGLPLGVSPSMAIWDVLYFDCEVSSQWRYETPPPL